MEAEGILTDSFDYIFESKHTILFADYNEVTAQYTDSDYNLNTGTLEQHNDPEGTPVLAEERYYRAVYAKARSEKIATRFLEEQEQLTIKDEFIEEIGCETEVLSIEGFGTVTLFCTKDMMDQYLFVRKGNEIEFINYEGPDKLENHIEEIIGDLSN